MVLWSSFVLVSVAVAQRVCQTPDCLFVENSSVAGTVKLFIYVPPTTSEFTVEIFDQTDDSPVANPSMFVLYTPDGSQAMELNNPKSKEWAKYLVKVNGRWGIWKLTVTGPKPDKQKQLVRNRFVVRTIGEVDLFVKLDPVVLAQSFRLSEPHFGISIFGDNKSHRFTVQIPDLKRVRFNFLRPRQEKTVQIHLQPPNNISADLHLGGLTRGTVEFLEVNGNNLQGLWQLTVENVKGIYAIGIEQELRLFFTDKPLMPMPQKVNVSTFIADDNLLSPARLEVSSPQTAVETYVTFTDRNGSGSLFLLPNIVYNITASKGFEFYPQTVFVTVDAKEFSVPIGRLLNRKKGWYCGDNHVHSVYSDGNDTPYQMAEAAMAEGLDWITLTDHGVGPLIQNVLMANSEALKSSELGKFVVIPGEEFTTPEYHANIINGVVFEMPTAPLQQVIDSVLKMNDEGNVITVKLNHPTTQLTSKAADLARSLDRLPLIELWNSPEPQTIQLWWELLNKGVKVFAETSTDSHNRKTSRLGHRRTYVYLGDKTLTPENIVKAMRDGHSFISRGALIFFTVNGSMSGETVTASTLTVHLEVTSNIPIERVELVQNGKVVHTFTIDKEKSYIDGRNFIGEIILPATDGWLLAQVIQKDTPIPLAMTNPVFIKRK